MGKFSQVEFDSLAPYEQKAYEMNNPRERVKRGEGLDAKHKRFMANVSDNMEAREKIQKATEAYRAKVGSDAGGKTITSGGGGGGAGIPKVGPKRPLEMKKGGKVSSASKRADGCAVKGKTRGRMI
jgi:hypothetical protein